MSGQVLLGDCREHLKSLPDDSVDSVVTDPPSGIKFMGAEWDHFKPSEEEEGAEGRAELLAFQNFLVEVFKEVYRVLKPGAHGLVWSLPRTGHHTAMALERCGFEIRDKISHIQSQGYKKGMDISKEIDKYKGLTRKVVGTKLGLPGYSLSEGKGRLAFNSAVDGSLNNSERECEITEPASPEAKQWEGWHTGLKPAVEEWILVRKPLDGKTLIANLLQHGVGAINIDACRVFTDWNEPDRPDSWKRSGHTAKPEAAKIAAPPGQGIECHPLGRWPANVILSHSPYCKKVGNRVIKAHPQGPDRFQKTKGGSFSKEYGNQRALEEDEVLPLYECAPGCPVLALDQSGAVILSRYFKTFDPDYEDPFYYVPKVSGSERKKDLEEEDFINNHPTVKSRRLMRYLVRLITPPGGLVLDPFAGSGTTIVACIDEGFNYLGFEQKPEYFKILEARVKKVSQEALSLESQYVARDLAQSLPSDD
jgi:DNA modification methylase